MLRTKMKKISMLIFRADFDKFINELILFGRVDLAAPGDSAGDAVLAEFLERENLDLKRFQTNQEYLTVFGTDYTLLLEGWIPSKSAQNLLTILSGYTHAWDIQDPAPDDLDNTPVEIRPKFLMKFYKGARKPFSPLVFQDNSEEN